MVHPTVTKACLAIFSCVDIDGVHRVYDDLEVICYSNEHKKIAIGIAFPGIIFWGLGIPAFGFILMYKNIKKG